MNKWRVGLVTGAEWPTLWIDDHPLQQALQKRGAEAVPLIWTDPGWATQRWDMLVLRSCWDYVLKLPRFLSWLGEVERARLPLWNPADVVRWNLDKRYLMLLEGDGIPIVPTIYLEPGRGASLPSILTDQDWGEAVLKPTISCGALRTRRLGKGDAAALLPALREIHQGSAGGPPCAALLQRFMPELLVEGELSFIFLGGALSHVVRKRARKGDFRVQEMYGGTVERIKDPDKGLVRAARAALRAAEARSGPALYARVDGVISGGELLLMEIELFEPSLFFQCDPHAAGRLADAILQRLGG